MPIMRRCGHPAVFMLLGAILTGCASFAVIDASPLPLSIFGLVSGGQIDRYNFETFRTVTDQLQQAAQAIKVARCSEGRIVYGAACDDVQDPLVHVSLNSIPAGPERDKPVAIPTGLTISRPDVDLLVLAGQTAATTSPQLREFLDGYPPRLPTTRPARARASSATSSRSSS